MLRVLCLLLLVTLLVSCSDSGRVHHVKIILLGPTAAGKSSFLQRLIHNRYLPDHTLPTIGAAFQTIQVSPTMTLQFWDTAGEERYRALTAVYSRGAQVAVFVFDVSSVRSMELMQSLFEEMSAELRLNECLLLVLGMKKDLLSSTECATRMDNVAAEMKNQGIAQFYATTAVNDREFEETKTGILNLIVDHAKNKMIKCDTGKLRIDQSHDADKEPNCHC